MKTITSLCCYNNSSSSISSKPAKNRWRRPCRKYSKMTPCLHRISPALCLSTSVKPTAVSHLSPWLSPAPVKHSKSATRASPFRKVENLRPIPQLSLIRKYSNRNIKTTWWKCRNSRKKSSPKYQKTGSTKRNPKSFTFSEHNLIKRFVIDHLRWNFCRCYKVLLIFFYFATVSFAFFYRKIFDKNFIYTVGKLVGLH